MNSQRFDIIGAAAFGFQSVFAARKFLTAIAVVPVCIVTGIELLKIFALERQSLMTELISLIPISVAGAWFMFLQTRMMVFGETTPDTYKTPAEERRRAFEACALLWVLMQMIMLALLAYGLFWQQHMASGSVPAPVNILGYLLIGATFWGLRFSVVHILGATGYPIRQFIFRVNGAMVSLRMLALMCVVMFPIALVLSPVDQALYAAVKADEISPLGIAGLSLLRVIFNFIVMAVFNAAGIYALRQMLGNSTPHKGISV